MRYRLGLDMGTNSIGFAVLGLDNDNNPKELVDMGVRIFHDGRDAKTHEPLSLARRQARGLRTQRDRKIRRKNAVINSLVANNLFPSNIQERDKLKLIDPYEVRVKAINQQISRYELGRALYHICSRRGFKSNRITDSETKEVFTNTSKKMSQNEKMSNLEIEMKNTESRTIGEYLYKRIQRHCGARFRGGDFNCYPSREQYISEFNCIKEKQSLYYNDINWDEIYNVIFTQRKLKKQERGRCPFYTEEERAYSILPSSQEFRILSDINNLRYIDELGNELTLSDSEKDFLYSSLNTCKSKTFSAIKKDLKDPSILKFTIEDERRDKLRGNTIAVDMRKEEFFGVKWDSLDLETQDNLIEILLESETDDEIMNYLNNFNLNDTQKKNLLELHLPKNVGSLSSKIMRECIDVMKQKHCRYDEAISFLGLHHSYNPIRKLQGSLPYYGQVLTKTVMNRHPEADESNVEYKYGKIANPTVHIALNQLRQVVNALISHYGTPEQIVIELSRDISNSAEEKKRINRELSLNQKENERIKTDIQNLGVPNPTAWDVKKYKLWEELGKDNLTRCCPYCGNAISAAELFTKNIEIEHILPYSRTMLDSMNNLTLAHSHCNLKKKEQTPYEAFSSSPDGYNWNDIVERATKLPYGKGNKFSKNAMSKFEEEGFVARQLNDNRFLSRATKEYLACICPQNQIWTIKGQNTAILRRNWGLNTLLNNDGNPYIKNRSDHRHHSIDALVIGMTDRSLVKKMADMNINNLDVSRIKAPELPFSLAVISDKLREMHVSYKANHGHQGRIFQETATGLKKVKTIIPMKNLKKDDIYEDRLVNKELQKKLSDSLLITKSMTKSLNEILPAAIRVQNTDEPKISVFRDVWVTRVNLIDLTAKDIQAKRIFNKKLQSYIEENTVDVINDSKLLAQRLQEISDKTNVKRVRYIPNRQIFTKIKSVPNKWYEKDSICFATIWAIPGNKKLFKGQFISYQEVYDFDSGKIKEYPKPHPAAKKIMTLYKNDIVLIVSKDKTQSYFAVVAGFNDDGKSGRLDLQPVNCAETIEKWVNSVNVRICSDWTIWENAAPGQNYKAINVLLSENDVRSVYISPDGKITL